MKIKIGKKAYIALSEYSNKILSSDYAGKTGTIKFCNKCCKQNRIQFDGMANNELLSNFNILKCEIYETKD